MKTNIRVFLKILIIAVCCISCNEKLKIYQIEVTYCDTRPKKIIYVRGFGDNPTTKNISRDPDKRLTEYEGELNVCEIKTLKTINIE